MFMILLIVQNMHIETMEITARDRNLKFFSEVLLVMESQQCCCLLLESLGEDLPKT